MTALLPEILNTTPRGVPPVMESYVKVVSECHVSLAFGVRLFAEGAVCKNKG